MASLGERVEHALKTRGKKAAHLDKYLAVRFGKKGDGAGYVHRILKKGLQPGPDELAAIADFLGISLEWLVRGQGGMDREGTPTATYDSLEGWADAAAEEAEAGRVQPYAIRAAGRSPAMVRPVRVDAEFVFKCAMFWLGAAPEEERRGAAEAEARRIKADEDARQRKG